ncbi:hypothetical protein OIY81_39 [Cryptosporidium canis]|nr:hypothetical protein OIY81_39 [Cryptosporidium canis]
METERFRIEMLDYYSGSGGVVYRINIYNKKSSESWDIERSYSDFEQVDHLLQYRYPGIPKRNKEFYESRFQDLRKYLYAALESDYHMENMVLAYFLDLNLVVSESGTVAETNIEKFDVDVLESFKDRLLNVANSKERSLAPMERKAREKQYSSILGDAKFFSGFYDLEVMNPHFTREAPSQTEDKGLPASVLDQNATKELESELTQSSSQDQAEIISLMEKVCKEISVSLESKINPLEMKELKQDFQPIDNRS